MISIIVGVVFASVSGIFWSWGKQDQSALYIFCSVITFFSGGGLIWLGLIGILQ